MTLSLDYSTLRGHELMLRDSVRCKAFRQAIADVVTPGCAVLDIGAGVGILSLFAAQAGARVVYAVERTPIAQLAKRIVSDNGFGDRIHVLQDDIEAVELPEKVDVIVSEWLGGYGVDENLLPVVVLARDRWLKPTGRLIPETVTSWLAPVCDERLQQDIDFWSSEPYGINLNAIGQATARQLGCACNHVRQEHLLSDAQLMWEIDVMAYSQEEANQPLAARLGFVADRDGPCNALAAWFRAQLSEQVVLCNGPSERDTHWGRSLFPIGKTLGIQKGTRVDAHFVHEPQGKGQSRSTWAVEVGGYRFHSEGLTVLTSEWEDWGQVFEI